MHVVRNTGTATRIHLVIDCFPTKELLELFPAQFQVPEVLAETLIACDVPPLTQAEMDALSCTFDIPASFRSYEEPGGQFLTAQPTVPAAITHHGGSLALFLEGKPALALIHVGSAEFRFAGWTIERTIQVTRLASAMRVTLRSRTGTTVYQGSFPASPIRPRYVCGTAPPTGR